MPVFARVATADPVEATSITSADEASSVALSDAICTCPVSDHDLMDGIIHGRNVHADYTHVQLRGHLSTCAFYTNGNNNNTPAFAQLKQQALLKQQRHLQQQQQLSKRRRDPFESVRQLPTRTCHLFPGSRFAGKQCSGTHSYDVLVDIKHVNLTDSTLCGYLHIKGLTEEYPELTTFFDAEIVGSQYSFLTRKWDASTVTDEEHWTLFQPFEHIASLSRLEDVKFDFRDKDVVFMRWKEHFLVPDHRVEGITGASFAGFYYICYHKLTGQIRGYYYHHSSEKFQQLILEHVEERKSFGSYEFR